MKLGTQIGLGSGHIVLDGDPASLTQRGIAPSPKFSAHIYCGQMARCIKMPLGMEVGLSPGDFVLDGDPAPPQKGGGVPNFRPMSIADTTWYGSRPLPRPRCIRRGPSYPRKGHSSLPSFRPVSITATVAHLLLSSCSLAALVHCQISASCCLISSIFLTHGSYSRCCTIP